MLPVLFVSHGAPTMALKQAAPLTVSFLQSLGTLLGLSSPTPSIKAAIVISAHWETNQIPAVTSAPNPQQIYDFYGFPKHLYEVKYDIRGSSEHAATIQTLLGEEGLNVELDSERGHDHGVWIPMMHIMPGPHKLPIIQLSITKNLDYLMHMKMGKALRRLRREGYLILGSGGAVHNLGRVNFDSDKEDSSGSKSESWAVSFQNDLIKVLGNGGGDGDGSVSERLLQWIGKNKDRVKMAHPRTEHFMPLVVVAAACEDDEHLKVMNNVYQFGNFGLAAWISSK